MKNFKNKLNLMIFNNVGIKILATSALMIKLINKKKIIIKNLG